MFQASIIRFIKLGITSSALRVNEIKKTTKIGNQKIIIIITKNKKVVIR